MMTDDDDGQREEEKEKERERGGEEILRGGCPEKTRTPLRMWGNIHAKQRQIGFTSLPGLRTFIRRTKLGRCP
eukprot:3697950-Pyramimonas_sp.AAC.1